MNDLPQNELLSAYLDGELTAAEQAEAERLLASSPAARQLLDELRAVSATLQSLPRQKLGEDLSQQVLRVAERRMLTEGEPGDAAPVPLSQTVFRRFINRRSMFWVGLTAAVAVMIAIHERQQKTIPANNTGKEIARANGDRDRMTKTAAGDSFRPATIQAAPGAVARGALKKGEATELTVEKKSGKAPQESEKVAMVPKALKSLKPGGGANLSEAPPADQLQDLNASAAPANATPLASTPPPPTPGHMGKFAGAVGKAAAAGGKSGPSRSLNWYEGDGAASISPDVLLVFCDVSPDATKKKAFDRVLAENGIASHRRVESKDRGQELGEHLEHADKAADAAGEEAVTQRLARGAVVRRKAVVGNAELVYVEATPEQVKATLASLNAQPKVFVSISVKSAQDQAARQLVRRFAMSGQEPQTNSTLSGAYGKSDGENRPQNDATAPRLAAAKPTDASATSRGTSTASQKGDVQRLGGRDEKKRAEKKADATRESAPAKAEKGVSVEEQRTNEAQAPTAGGSFGGASPTSAAKPGPAPPSKREPQTKAGVVAQQAAPAKQAAGASEEAKAERQGGGQPTPSQPYGRSAPRQRVLFVVRMGDNPHPLASQAGGRPGDPAKQAPAPAPADPAPSK